MRYTLSLAALVIATTALGLRDLPACSSDCVLNGIAWVGCDQNDTKCACEKATEVAANIKPCILSACSGPTDRDRVMWVVRNICTDHSIFIDVGPAPDGETQYSATSCHPVILQPSMPSGYIPRPASTLIPKEVYRSAVYPGPPIATESCSSTRTLTTTLTIPVVTQIPSSLLTIPGTVDLSSFAPQPTGTETEEPYEPCPTSSSGFSAPWWPTTSVTGVIELSTFTAPQESYYSPAGSLASEISSIASELSSIAAPAVPYPTETTESAGSAVPPEATESAEPVYPTETTESAEPIYPTATETSRSASSSAVYWTGSYTSQLPEFTNAAEAGKVPAVVAGVLGVAAWVL